MRPALLAVLQSVFKVRPEEARRTGYAFIYLFMAIGAFIVGRIARTVLFLEMPDYKQLLPFAYIGTAVSVSSAMILYARFERRLRRDVTNAITLGLLTAVTLAFRFALHTGETAVYWAFYFWVEIYGTFCVVQFWSLANEIFHARQAKRLFAVVGGGGVLANVVIGVAVSGAVKNLGTENLLYFVSACFVVCLTMVILLGRDARAELQQARAKQPARGRHGAPPAGVFTSRHVQLISVVVVLTYLASTLVDYQFQAIIGDTIPGKDERSAYLGSFFAYTGVIAGVIQLFFTSRLLERFGLLVALILLPLTMLGGSGLMLIGVLMTPLWAVAFTKGSENCLRYTINDSTLQLLYLPLPPQVRGRAKTTIDGILKPVSIGVAGFALALLVGSLEALTGFSLGFRLDPYDLTWAIAGCLGLWIFGLLGLRREYVKSLLSTLQRRRLNFAEASFTVNDEQTIRTLERVLDSPNIGEVLHALELLGSVSKKGRESVDGKVVALLQHSSNDVQVAALAYLRRNEARLHAEDVALLLEDDDGQVRSSAVLAFCSIERERSIGRAQKLLSDRDVRVRAATVAGLVRYGGLDGVLASAELLKHMLQSGDAPERQHAAWVLGEIGVATFYQPLVPLFADPNERVRLAAIDAAGRLQSLELIPQVVEQLGTPHLAGAAVAALAAYGDKGLEVATALVGNIEATAEVRANASRTLARLGDPRGAETLGKHLLEPNVKVRTAVVQSLAALVAKNPGIRVEPRSVVNALRAEARGYFERCAVLDDLALDAATPLLTDALTHQQALAVGRVLALLGLKYPASTIELVGRSVRSGTAATRANAVEVLDNLLTSEEKALLVPIFDEIPAAQRATVGRDLFGVRSRDRLARLRELLSGDDPWLRACAAVAAGDLGLRELEPDVRTMLSSRDPVGRETAIGALYKLKSLAILRERLPALVEDPEQAVRRYARHVQASLPAAT